MRKTHEGALTYEHSLNHALEFFSKAGSIFVGREGFYGIEESALSLFQKTWIVDEELSFKLLLWLRDCRGGAGNRSGSRQCFNWLAQVHPEWITRNIHWIPTVGRWDDLRSLFGTSIEKNAAEFWAEALKDGNVLAAKWCDRRDEPVRKVFGYDVPTFRKFIASIRKNHIVEHKMCQKEWNGIEYKTVPSLAMARYTNAFNKHDRERFAKYKEKLASRQETVHASVLFPHDCVRTSIYGDRDIADAQFDALPNYFGDGADAEKIIVIADTSGSMDSLVSPKSKVKCVDISQGLALYCSAKMPEDSPFYKRFIQFESESEFSDWRNMTFSEAVHDRKIFNRAIGSTRIDKALRLILKTAVEREIPQDMMPTTLMIVSDMQFSEGSDTKTTQVKNELEKFEAYGYEKPKVVYWNTSSYAGSQATKNDKNVAMVSGYSPSLLKALFEGEDFSPMGVMMKTLEKYNEVLKPQS